MLDSANAPVAGQIAELFAREEAEREPPYGRVLDLGCASDLLKAAALGWLYAGSSAGAVVRLQADPFLA